MPVTTTEKPIVSDERRDWLQIKAFEQWDLRDTSDVEANCVDWFNTVMDAHTAVHKIIGGTRTDIKIDLAALSNQCIMTMIGPDDSDYRLSFNELATLIDIFDRDAFNILFRGDYSGQRWPDWIFSGQLKSGMKATKVLSRTIVKIKKLVATDQFDNTVARTFHNRVGLEKRLDRAAHHISTLGNIKADIAKFKAESEPLTVSIVAEPHHFLRMGKWPYVDLESCYRSGHQYDMAPFAISYHPRSVMFYVKRDKKVIGRAWGGLFRDCAISTNIYPNRDTSMKAVIRSTINKALSELYSSLWSEGLKTQKITISGAGGIVYYNGDAKIHKPSDPDFKRPNFWLDGKGINRDSDEPIADCDNCGEPIHEDDDYEMIEDDRICQHCIEQNYIYVESRNTYMLSEDTIYDDIDDEYIWGDDAVELVDGRYTHLDNAVELYTGEYALPNDVVDIEWGDYEGAAAHRDDEALIYREGEEDDSEYSGESGWGIE